MRLVILDFYLILNRRILQVIIFRFKVLDQTVWLYVHQEIIIQWKRLNYVHWYLIMYTP